MSSRVKHVTVCEGGSIHRPRQAWSIRKTRSRAEPPDASRAVRSLVSSMAARAVGPPKISFPARMGKS